MTSPYLLAEHQPTPVELDVANLRVTGELPRGLEGLYVRNSPTPHYEPIGKYHWFDGDGMVHGLRFEGGAARYVNKWVRTRGFEHEAKAGKALWTGILEPLSKEAFALPGGPAKDTANTDLVFHNQKLLALWWLSGQPYELSTKDLSTLGPATFGGALKHGMSAHPKVDPRTGELVFFDYSVVKQPWLRYGVVSAKGELVRSEVVELPAPHVLHDMAITERYSVLLDFPLGWDAKALAQGKRRIGFDRTTPARFGVLPRLGTARDVRWFEAEPCYMYHTSNAFEDGPEVVVQGCRVKEMIPQTPDTSGRVAKLDTIELIPFAYEWRFNLETGAVRERQLDDVPTEFPRINDGVKGTKARYAYHPRVAPRDTLLFDGLIKYDLVTGARQTWNAPKGWYVGEAAFAADPKGGGEDAGWLVTHGTNAAEQTSATLVFDARDLAAGPVATVHLPQRIPIGFHSYWCPGPAA